MKNFNTLPLQGQENFIPDKEFLALPIEERLAYFLNTDYQQKFDDPKTEVFGFSEIAPHKKSSGDSILVESELYEIKYKLYPESNHISEEKLEIKVLGVLDGVSVPKSTKQLIESTYHIFSKIDGLQVDQLGSALVRLAVHEALKELKNYKWENIDYDKGLKVVNDEFLDLFYEKIRKVSYESITGNKVSDDFFTPEKFFISGFVEWAEKHKEILNSAGYEIEDILRENSQYNKPIQMLLFPMVAYGLDIGISIPGTISNQHFLYVNADVTAIFPIKSNDDQSFTARSRITYNEIIYRGGALEKLDHYTGIVIDLLKYFDKNVFESFYKDSIYTWFYLIKHAFGLVPVLSCSPMKTGPTMTQFQREVKEEYSGNKFFTMISDGLRFGRKNFSPSGEVFYKLFLLRDQARVKLERNNEYLWFLRGGVQFIEQLNRIGIISNEKVNNLLENLDKYDKTGSIFFLFHIMYELNALSFKSGRSAKQAERDELDDATILVQSGTYKSELFGSEVYDLNDIFEYDPQGSRSKDFAARSISTNFKDANERIRFYIRDIVIPYVLVESKHFMDWESIPDKVKVEILDYYTDWLLDSETGKIRTPDQLIRIVGKDNPTEKFGQFRRLIETTRTTGTQNVVSVKTTS
jgi:hypothetical protein